ncbi:MAG: hypothetical protein EPO51_25340 [Phenylobacterium sp.]|nr:MAG: hypothetical protein EPO51_25340 [Phenylobacterium sp.]
MSYYGVSDLRQLGEATHKFESGYLKTLVGASDLADPVFAARSPITHAAQISAPVLLLQDADDKVNPPEQSLSWRAGSPKLAGAATSICSRARPTASSRWTPCAPAWASSSGSWTR